MSDQDNLRDRIADILEALDGMDLDQQAQAIIDDLGLTVETMTLGGMREDGAPFTSTQVVGRWEKS